MNFFLPALLSVILLALHTSILGVAANLLQNGDFAEAPTGVSLNGTNLAIPIKTLPNWQVQGTVLYVEPGTDFPTPSGGHAVQIGSGGSISQGFNATPGSVYSVTFTIGTGCSVSDSAGDAINVTVGSDSEQFLVVDIYEDELWETYAWGFETSATTADIVFQGTGPDPSSNCSLLLDAVLLTELPQPNKSSGNLLINGDFEVGPSLIGNSSIGVLLPPNGNASLSPLPGWTIGPSLAAKYIDSRNFYVPQGQAAVELLTAEQGKLTQTVNTEPGTTYSLQFLLGDANDSCKGSVTIRVETGADSQPFSYVSLGSGNSTRMTLKFTATSSSSDISFVGVTHNSIDGNQDIVCGPVIDDVILTTTSSSFSILFKWRTGVWMHLLLLGFAVFMV